MSRREVWFAPAWPARYGPLWIDDVPLGDRRVTLTVDDTGATLEGLPDDVTLIRRPRPPLEPADPSVRA
jgi:hypothetical protein